MTSPNGGENQEKIALVTGSTDGIGKQTALELGQQGIRVFIHGRSAEHGESTIQELREFAPAAHFDLVVGDLSSMAQVRKMAEDLKNRIKHLDILINNAGVKPLKRIVTEDGLDLTFAINHLAHFLLTNLLLDK